MKRYEALASEIVVAADAYARAVARGGVSSGAAVYRDRLKEEITALTNDAEGAVSDRDALAEAARAVVFAFLAGSLTRADVQPLVYELDRLGGQSAVPRDRASRSLTTSSGTADHAD